MLYCFFFVLRSIANWFDEDGRLVVEKFYADFSDLYSAVKNKKSN